MNLPGCVDIVDTYEKVVSSLTADRLPLGSAEVHGCLGKTSGYLKFASQAFFRWFLSTIGTALLLYNYKQSSYIIYYDTPKVLRVRP